VQTEAAAFPSCCILIPDSDCDSDSTNFRILLAPESGILGAEIAKVWKRERKTECLCVCVCVCACVCVCVCVPCGCLCAVAPWWCVRATTDASVCLLWLMRRGCWWSCGFFKFCNWVFSPLCRWRDPCGGRHRHQVCVCVCMCVCVCVCVLICAVYICIYININIYMCVCCVCCVCVVCVCACVYVHMCVCVCVRVYMSLLESLLYSVLQRLSLFFLSRCFGFYSDSQQRLLWCVLLVFLFLHPQLLSDLLGRSSCVRTRIGDLSFHC